MLQDLPLLNGLRKDEGHIFFLNPLVEDPLWLDGDDGSSFTEPPASCESQSDLFRITILFNGFWRTRPSPFYIHRHGNPSLRTQRQPPHPASVLIRYASLHLSKSDTDFIFLMTSPHSSSYFYYFYLSSQ